METPKETPARLRARLDALRPLPPATLASLREAVALEWTYNSIGIEGNTLTLKETKVVLEGITVGGKTVREHLEAINHAEAIRLLEAAVARSEPLAERLVRELHGVVLRGIDDKNAGAYRRENVVVSGAVHRPPDHLHVREEMEKLFRDYAARGGDGGGGGDSGSGRETYGNGPADEPALGRAAWLHSEIARIHPFVDGNGRTARLVMNLELMRHGWPPAVIRKEDRPRYYEALDRAHTTGDAEPFARLVEERVEATLRLYLDVIRP